MSKIKGILWDNVSFKGADLKGADLTDVKWQDADLRSKNDKENWR